MTAHTKDIIFADFGNSNAKFLLSDGSFQRTAYSSDTFDNLLSKINLSHSKIVYSSVNNTSLELLKNYKNIELVNAFELLKKTEPFHFSAIEGIGHDRLFGIAGALAQTAPPLITIDCGTAVTINILDEKKKMLGGFIIPGYNLQEFALRRKTQGLRNIEIQVPDTFIGTNTNEAISSGIFNLIGGGVRFILQKLKNETFPKNDVKIFLTGGSSHLILPYLKDIFPIIHDELLVLKGIKQVYENWSSENN